MPAKHYYIEGERICTKIGGGFGLVTPPPPIDTAGGNNSVSIAAQLWTMVNRGFQCTGNTVTDISILPGFSAINNSNNTENFRYYYHPDHLGSSSFITNQSGNVIEHLQYLPYGENFVSQRSGRYDTPYKFSGKEKDDETSYSYFGARYYDSDLSIWLSVDPLASKYPSLSPRYRTSPLVW